MFFILAVSEPFFVQKIDLIAELKMSKDISGIKKLKVERAQVEKSQEQNLISEISKTCNVSKFVDQVSCVHSCDTIQSNSNNHVSDE